MKKLIRVSKTKIDLLAILLLIILCVSFFLKLFWPKPAIFATAEIGVNDVWYINYPLKFFLGQTLKLGKLPVWNPYRAGGFPEIAENQAGTYNFYNLSAFSILPTITAFNLGYVVIFITTALGMYLFIKRQEFPPLLAIYGASIYTFSGFFVTHISHFLLIQTASFFPWLMYFADKILKDKIRIFTGIGFAIILSQQIFSGNPQTVFISCVGIFIFTIYLLLTKQTHKRQLLLLIVSGGVGVVISAAQLLPTWELTSYSLRGRGLNPTELLFYKYPLLHLITFIFPFWFGNPQQGTYPHFRNFNGSLFWENTGYIGIIPILFIIAGLFSIRKFRRQVPLYVFLVATTFLLMLGGDGPLYFLVLLPPFSFFRFPSRFMLIFLFGLVMLSLYGTRFLFEYLRRRVPKVSRILTPLLIIGVGQLFFFWYWYHPTVVFEEFDRVPDTAEYLHSIPHGKIYTFKQHAREMQEFFRTGSSQPARYIQYRNELAPNLNVLFNLATTDVYSSLIPERVAYYNSILLNDYRIASDSGRISPDMLTHLSLRNTTHILSPLPLTNDVLKLENKFTLRNELGDLYLYKNIKAVPKYYLVHKYRLAQSVEEIFSVLRSQNFEIANEVILEKSLPQITPVLKNSSARIEVQQENFEDTIMRVETDQPAILVLNQTYYPGWHAYINDKETDIFPVNLVNQGVLVPEGTYKIRLVFRSDSIKFGLWVSIIGYVVLGAIFIATGVRKCRYFGKS